MRANFSPTLNTVNLTELAWAAHEAESADDDISFIEVMNEVERRNAWKLFREEYIRLWPTHAGVCDYCGIKCGGACAEIGL